MKTAVLISFLVFSRGVFFSGSAYAQRAFDNFVQASRERNVADLVVACQQGYNQSNICEMIMELQQLGADAVETVKAIMPLGPLEYFILTMINLASTGRLRAQVQPFIHPDVKNTLEYRHPDEFWILLSYQF